MVIRVKRKILNCIRYSNREAKKFNPKKSENILHLQQAGNKMFKAFNLLIKGISQQQIKTDRGIEITAISLIKSYKDLDIKDLWRDVEYLHTFFYEGDGSHYMIKQALENSTVKLILLIKKYNLK